MNTSNTDTQAPLSEPPDRDDIDFLGLFNVVFETRWLILLVTVIALLLGVAYAFLSRPVYQADTLIQVEEGQTNANNALGALASVFNVKSPASAEMEILRSRLVVGQAADDLQLYISATPHYLPVIGAWLARRATQLSNPGFFGFGGYVSGTESIQLGQLDVPEELEGQSLTLITTATGYTLQGPLGLKLAEGKIGVPSDFNVNSAPGRILVTGLNAKPGAEFTLVRRSRLNVVQGLQDRLEISERGKQTGSGVLSMSLQGTNPDQITRILNAVGTAYVGQNVQRKAAEAEKSLTFLDDFLPQLKKQMDESENSYTKFRDQHGTFDLTTEGSLSLNTSVGLQTKLLDLQQKRRELASLYTPAHPTVRVIDQQISDLNKQLASLTSRIKTLPDLEQQLLNHVRSVKVNGEMYAGLLNSAQQLRLVKEGKVGNVRVVDAAITPEQPVKPNRPLVVTIAGMLGLIVGIAIALLRHWLRPGIQNAGDIESGLGLYVLATVPHSLPQTKLHQLTRSRTAGNHVLALSAPQDPAVESLRSLRMSVQFAMLEAKNNIVLVTGATPGVGKSFASVNFAAVLGAADKRVLLIDADLRSGDINQYFGLDRRNGFTELINGTLPLEEVLYKDIMPNVDLITAGVLPPNPAELLQSESAQQILQSLSAQYDVIIVDTTPVLAVSDAMGLARHASMVLMVARAQHSTLGELEESIKRLRRQAGVPVKGVIFNDLVAPHHRYGSMYGNYVYDSDEYLADKA